MYKTALLCDANYDRENNDSTNALRPRRFKWSDFIVLYARHFLLPVNFFSKYYFNKLCFQLPQTVTWTDE